MVRLLHIFPLVALAAFASADHHITFHNRCASKTITPTFHAADGTTRSMHAIAKGQTTSTTVAEAKAAWRIFGQTGSCSHPDGGGCLLLECSFEFVTLPNVLSETNFSLKQSVI
ncbi:hypothetical protein MVEN_02256000 [Mycena venus]|uniref:Uncharacterized protein n=1 Tax=Mycena venus TaxID=2733690 RepID=A0A8H6X5U0_9AGAR|nr:hypothetical protein MVEN_02256000 [Mycena venus]